MMKWEALESGSGEADDAFEDRRCAGCASSAPSVSAFTLISGSYRWRLHRTRAHGEPRMEWFCPACWAARRAFADVPANDPPVTPAPPRSTSVRATGSLDMTSTICRLLGTKLRARAARGPAVDKLLRALGEIELEASTWSSTTGTPERRKEIWMELRSLDARADDLIAGR